MVVNQARSMLLANVPLDKLQKQLHEADAKAAGRKGETKWDRDMAEFEICLIQDKLAYVDAHEKRAGK
jgi:hypothetical protein